MADEDTVTVEIVGAKEPLSVPWSEGMTARQALEQAAAQVGATEKFTYGLQYYGREKAYLLLMINETYDSFGSSSEPSFYWNFYVNDTSPDTGIDNTVLNAGDVVRFEFEMYEKPKHEGTELLVKHEARRRG